MSLMLDDVVRLKYNAEMMPFATINDRLLHFKPMMTLSELKIEVMQTNPQVNRVSVTSRDGFSYHDAT